MSVVSICNDTDELVTRYAYGNKLSQLRSGAGLKNT
jgi:hypothetical protein